MAPNRLMVLRGAGVGVALAAVALFWAARLGPAGVAASTEPLPVFGDVPDFSLVDQQAQPVARADFEGRVWIADFIFTRCAGQCPMMSAQMSRLAQGARMPGVELVSFTVDPAYDTPDVLAGYAARYPAGPGRWRFLTGDAGTIRRLCQDGFKLSVAEGGTAEEPVIHSRRFVLVDRAGRIRGYYDSGEPDELRALERDARRLTAERG